MAEHDIQHVCSESGSVGICDGVSGPMTSYPCCSESCSSCRPADEMTLEPQAVCLALRSPARIVGVLSSKIVWTSEEQNIGEMSFRGCSNRAIPRPGGVAAGAGVLSRPGGQCMSCDWTSVRRSCILPEIPPAFQ
ncbi:hypothetical protein EVAR_46686_1 [Eumeta japonica]|uniref:Uncharacterized protein n=1 Tax=Eumeta variegata TaxID=151549 RepID=A0A4C1Y1T1_EUMVA|nr:hypothetical protein EVAR_46686_1 [Eumeta japonica]